LLQAIRFLLGGVCHQLPAHSYWVSGQPLPLCARCSGTFLGIWAGLLTLRLMGRHRRTGLPSGVAAWAMGALAAFWAVDGVNSTLDMALGNALYAPSNLLRLVSGAGLGVALSTLVAPMCALAFGVFSDGSPVIATGRDSGKLLGAASVVVGAVGLGGWLPQAAWAMTLGAAVLGAVTLLNAALVRMIAPQLPRWAPRVAGVFLALVELGSVAALRTVLRI